tara:strand:- start:13393 stop:14838 length:1446 start_codon:yes stop_codon:yes gene_type:complete
MIKWNDLPPLNNVMNSFNLKKLNNKNIEDFKESIHLFIGDYLENNIRVYEKYHFNEIIYEDICDIISNTYGDIIYDSFSISVDTIIEECIDMYLLINDKARSYQKTLILKKPDIEYVKSVFKKVEKKEQPDQRTLEWYNFRWQLLTASSIWKAIDSQAMVNSIIYDKCKPIKIIEKQSVNINSPFHNGHKYEPLSVLMYEYLYDTKIGEFGCIRHDTIPFLGASPDGINIDEKNILYGRLLEIKNPVSDRLLNGIPKKDYWIQMQMQMEVWCLDECDFLETRFKTYENEEAFYKDGTFKKTGDNKYKGIVLQFYDGCEPIYEYPPFQINKKDFDEWSDKCIEKNSHLTWIGNTYWYLDKYSCALVLRNKDWFDTVKPMFKNVYDTIVEERITGYDHRKPKKRVPKIIKPTESKDTHGTNNDGKGNKGKDKDIKDKDIKGKDIKGKDIKGKDHNGKDDKDKKTKKSPKKIKKIPPNIIKIDI